MFGLLGVVLLGFVFWGCFCASLGLGAASQFLVLVVFWGCFCSRV
jgi:hypothetical protein